MMTDTRRTLARRVRHATADDSGSIAVAMMLIMVAVTSAALLAPLVISQITTTKVDARRNHSFDAAQAGVDAMVGLVRAANDGSTSPLGDLSKLPCTAAGPLTGDVAGTGAGTARYRVRVYSFASDPSGHDDWLDDPNKQIRCTSGGTAVTPAYAAISSEGIDSPGDWSSAPTRTLIATYVMKARNTNVPGGLIHADKTDPELCLDAGSSSPVQGTVVVLQPCESGADDQTWAYRTNSTISLVSSADLPSGDLGLCLTGASQTNGQLITVQPCAKTTSYKQQWTYGGLGANWHATTTDLRRSDTYCWVAAVPNRAGSNLTLNECSKTQTYEAARSFAHGRILGEG